MRAPDGTPTNAAHGFANMLMKVLREEAPTHVPAHALFVQNDLEVFPIIRYR